MVNPTVLGLDRLRVEGRRKVAAASPPPPLTDPEDLPTGYSRRTYATGDFEHARRVARYRYANDFEGEPETMRVVRFLDELVAREPGFIPYDSQDGAFNERLHLRQRPYVCGFILARHAERFVDFVNANGTVVAFRVSVVPDDAGTRSGFVGVTVDPRRVQTRLPTVLARQDFVFEAEAQAYIAARHADEVALVCAFDPVYGRSSSARSGLFEVMLAALDACARPWVDIPVWEEEPSAVYGVHQSEIDALLTRSPYFFTRPTRRAVAHLAPELQERLLRAAEQVRESLRLLDAFKREHGVDLARGGGADLDEIETIKALEALAGRELPLMLHYAVSRGDYGFTALARE